MSAVTLKSLKAAFKVARRDVLETRCYMGNAFPASSDWLPITAVYKGLEDWSVDRWASVDLSAPFDRAQFGDDIGPAANLYVIARDHGLNAAMLYKLSGGNIDPREREVR